MFSPHNLVQFGGLAATLGGAVIIVDRLLSALHPMHFGPSLFEYDLELLSGLPIASYGYMTNFIYYLFITLGIAGLFILLKTAGKPNKLTTFGLLLACSSTVALSSHALYGFWEFSRYGRWEEPFLMGIVSAVGSWSAATGLLLIGIAAFQEPDMFGKWRFLPLVLALLISPLGFLLTRFLLEVAGLFLDAALEMMPGVLFELLPILIGATWILFGYLLWSRKDSMEQTSDDLA